MNKANVEKEGGRKGKKKKNGRNSHLVLLLRAREKEKRTALVYK